MDENPRTGRDADALLMLEVARGNSAAYSRLYRKYFPIVASYIAKLDRRSESAEDLAQEVFVRVWENRSKYRLRAAVKTFLFGYARIVLQEKRARITRDGQCDTRYFLEQASHRLDTHAMTQDDDKIQSVKKAIAHLADRERQALELVYVADYSVAKAAEVLKCSTRSVHLSLHRARKKLGKLPPSS